MTLPEGFARLRKILIVVSVIWLVPFVLAVVIFGSAGVASGPGKIDWLGIIAGLILVWYMFGGWYFLLPLVIAWTIFWVVERSVLRKDKP